MSFAYKRNSWSDSAVKRQARTALTSAHTMASTVLLPTAHFLVVFVLLLVEVFVLLLLLREVC